MRRGPLLALTAVLLVVGGVVVALRPVDEQRLQIATKGAPPAGSARAGLIGLTRDRNRLLDEADLDADIRKWALGG